MLKINEIFYSLQGETASFGYPCVFIRVSGCPLRCSYCDTEYAFYEGTSMTLDDILHKVQEYPCRRVTLTGGEPLAVPKSFELIKKICDLDYDLQIETSGAFSIHDVDPRARIILDVKSPSSNESGSFHYDNLNHIRYRDEIKFVLSDRPDYEWACTFIKQYRLSGYKILFSPTHDVLLPATLAQWILEDSIDVRLQIQLHKYLWPNQEKGV